MRAMATGAGAGEKAHPGGMRAAHYLKAALTGLAAGFCLAFVLGHDVWLEMRVTVGYALPASMAAFLLFAVVRKESMALAAFLGLQVLGAILLVSDYGFGLSALLTIPACLMREGFHLFAVPLTGIDLMLALVLGVADVVWISGALAAGLRGRRGTDRAG
jgi:hypothetical protein